MQIDLSFTQHELFSCPVILVERSWSPGMMYIPTHVVAFLEPYNPQNPVVQVIV